MAKHRARMLRARAESLENMAGEFRAYADELETQGATGSGVTEENPGGTEPECPWETGDWCKDFVTFYQLEISDKTIPPGGGKPDLARPFSRMSIPRRQKLRTREKDPMLTRDKWEKLAKTIVESSFLRGYGYDRRWSGATLEWVLNPTNLQKILEGNYKQDVGRSSYAEAERQLNERFDQDEKKLEGGRAI